MKNYLIPILLLASFQLHAQIQYGTWRTTVGNTDYHHLVRTGGGAALYINQVSTNSLYPILRLSSHTDVPNQNIRFTVENNGNVGIGTSTPQQQLHLTNKLMLNWNDANNVSTNDSPTIYASGQGAAYPFSGRGNLILQPRATDSDGFGDLVVMTGQNATTKFVVRNSGNVGIGTISPGEKLWIENGNIAIDNVDGKGLILYQQDARRFGKVLLEKGSGTGSGTKNTLLIEAGNTYGPQYGQRVLFRTGASDRMVIEHDGNVGIGTTSPSHKLEVNGTIRSQEVKVEATGWPDYVFEPTYNLRTLEETEAYIQSNKHLPEIPSAKEMEANGVQLGEMNMLLLKKIEELTLHTIAQQKEIDRLKNSPRQPQAATPLFEKRGEETEGRRGELEKKIEELLKRIEKLEGNQE